MVNAEEKLLCTEKPAELVLSEVNWHDDRVTRSFIKRRGDLLMNPSKMSPFELSEATTYCRSVNNPYARELAVRAGMGEAYNKKRALNTKGKLVKEAASTFGISLF
jgi:hypothetical protein